MNNLWLPTVRRAEIFLVLEEEVEVFSSVFLMLAEAAEVRFARVELAGNAREGDIADIRLIGTLAVKEQVDEAFRKLVEDREGGYCAERLGGGGGGSSPRRGGSASGRP